MLAARASSTFLPRLSGWICARSVAVTASTDSQGRADARDQFR
jgi:hypothetical protein